ncbi:MAG TPA: DUF4349 domain-containing protein [Chthoniobacterales bacterium]|jgi:hypothetical protein
MKAENEPLTPESIHDDFDDWAAAALLGALSETERLAFADHLAACPRCQGLYQETESMNETLTNTFEQERPSPYFENKLVLAFRAGERKSWLARVPETIAWLMGLRGVQTAGVLAALTLLVTVGNKLTGVEMPTTPLAVHSASQKERGSDFAFAASDTAEDSRKLGRSGAFGDSPQKLGEDQDYFLADGAAKESNASGISDAAAFPMKQQLALNAPSKGDRADFEQKNEGNSRSRSKGDSTGPLTAARKSVPAAPQPAGTPAILQAPVTPADEAPAAAADQAGESLAPAQQPAEPNPGLVDARKLIRNASVELEVASFDVALDKLGTAATQAGGYVATKNSARGGNGKLRGTVVIKVLPQHLDGFLLELRSFGEVKNQTLGTQDVTKEYSDTAARLRNAQRMEERLLEMLADAKGKISDILQVEKELGRVRESIETMQGELKLYDSLVSYATVTISLYEKDLTQPAAFLLQQSGSLDLLAADVEKTYAEARRIAEAAKAQISDASVTRDANGRVNATMQLLIPAPAAESTLHQLKGLGRIQNFNSQTQRTAQNGSAATSGTENAKVENAPASFRVSIQHDQETRRQIRFTVFTRDLDQAFDAAKKSAAEAGAEVVNSNLVRPQNGGGNATLVVRVPAAKHAELVATLQKLGRASDYQVQRSGSGSAAENDDAAPILVSLSLTDEEPSVQQTRLRVQSDNLETRVQEFKKAALAAGATVRDSGYQRQTDGRESAQVVLRFPLNKYASLLAQAQALGKPQELSVERRDTAAVSTTDSQAPAELSIHFVTENKIVADNTGLLATLRRTASQAIASLLWSVQMIGVALAFLAPWALGLGVAWLVVRRLRRKK